MTDQLWYENNIPYLFSLKKNIRGSRRFCQMGFNFDNIRFSFFFILVNEGREDPSTTISGPSPARQQNAI